MFAVPVLGARRIGARAMAVDAVPAVGAPHLRAAILFDEHAAMQDERRGTLQTPVQALG